VRGDLGQRVLAAAEADFQPDFLDGAGEGGARVGRGGSRRQAEPRQGDVEEALLAGAERVAAAAAVEAVGDAFGERRCRAAAAALSD
jgi:hypothetical protein